MKIALIPIDNRPICYDLISDIIAIDKNIELFLPKLEDLGGLTTQSNIENLFNFIENLNEVDYLILSLDTIAYGGLVSSRRCNETFKEIKKRIEKLQNIASKKAKKILAFSSIMRISNNNINEEEKEYWKDYGKMIFDWSFNSHKAKIENQKQPTHNIPKDILEDYLETRKRNFQINKLYLNLAQEGFFDTLIFSKDDCAEFGLNVEEANFLEKEIQDKNIKNAKTKTGADEIPLSLLSKALTNQNSIKIKPVFLNDKSTNLISKYEDISIKNCVLGQLELANCLIDNQNFDLTMLVNNFEKEQGDLVLGSTINYIEKEIIFPKKPYFICDVNNANGSDKKLIKQIFESNLENLHSYCGYNTSANTIGCAILIAIVKFLAQKNKSYNDKAFKKVLFTRFLDDWAYQSISRKFIRESAPEFLKALKDKENELLENGKIISNFLNYFPKTINFSLPWDRSFEIRIKIED